MTDDRLEKVRKEVERLLAIADHRIDNNRYNIDETGLDEDESARVHAIQKSELTYLNGKAFAYQRVLFLIDSMQEKSKHRFEVGQTITDPDDSTFTFHINRIEDGKYIESDDAWVLIKDADEEYELVEEPKKCMYSKDHYTDEDRKVLCEGCEEECEYAKKEVVIKVWHDAREDVGNNRNILILDEEGRGIVTNRENLINGYGEWGQGFCRWAYVDDLLKLSNVERNRKNWKEEPISENLEEASEEYAYTNWQSDDYHDGASEGLDFDPIGHTQKTFKAGANWQVEQFEKNRLKHCNNITNEQAELEQDFIDQHLDKHQRMPTFLDAIEYGMNLQKEQMIKDAVETEVKWVVKSALQNKLSDIKGDNMDRVEEIKELLQSIFDANYAMVRINGDFKNREKLKIVVLKEE